MENLEKYINDNLEQLGSYEMPQGHKERFLARLAAQELNESASQAKAAAPQTESTAPHSKKITFWNRRRIISAASVAAVVAIGMLATLNPSVQEMFYRHEIKKCAQQIYIEESEILQMLEEDEQYMINNLKTITEEAVPLEEQLPAELSPEKRAEILIRYYKAKSSSLKNFKTLYAQGGVTETDY